MKKSLLLVPLILSGCVNIDTSQVTPDGTNRFSGTFFCAKGTAEKIEVASKTKTTSKLISARNPELSPDAETIKLLIEGLGTIAGVAARSAAGIPPVPAITSPASSPQTMTLQQLDALIAQRIQQDKSTNIIVR